MRVKKLPCGNYISFKCPGCKDHHVIPVNNHPRAWQFNNDLNLPTLSPSILVTWNLDHGDGKPSGRCHSFVKNGKIEFLSDCTHSMKSQTMDLEEIKDERN